MILAQTAALKIVYTIYYLYICNIEFQISKIVYGFVGTCHTGIHASSLPAPPTHTPNAYAQIIYTHMPLHPCAYAQIIYTCAPVLPYTQVCLFYHILRCAYHYNTCASCRLCVHRTLIIYTCHAYDARSIIDEIET